MSDSKLSEFRMYRITREDVITAYQRLLGRPPDDEAMIEYRMKWCSAADLIESITQSAEYAARLSGPRPTRQDVIALYHAFLGRPPEDEAIIGLRMATCSFAELIASLTESPEYVPNRKAGLSRADVIALYDAVLSRPPENEVVIEAQMKLSSAAELIEELRQSAEFARWNKASRLTRADVSAVYRLVLGRPPESESVIESQIKVGSTAALIAELTSSAEFAERRRELVLTREDVMAIYQAVLGRPPEDEAVIASQIKVGSTAALIAELVGSEEFRHRNRSGLTRQDIITAYRALLGREPQSEATIELELDSASAGALIQSITQSQEYITRKKDTAYLYYTATFDPISVILAHDYPARQPKAGHLVNFLGVAMNLAFAPRLFAGHPGGLEGVPIPANWHADMAEFGAVLRAVNLARDTFTMIELGCGWGCWMINSGVAARRTGLRVKLIGAEADEGHLAFAAEALATNGFRPEDYVLHRCIAAAEAGAAFFPKQQVTGQNWALEPLILASEAERGDAIASGLYDELPTQSLQSIMGENRRIDLLHIDIQGGELELISRSISVLSEHVAYLVVGTHSRTIEGELIDQLTVAGWIPEIERPAIMGINDGQARVSTDGVQGWRNPRLLPLPTSDSSW